MNAPFKLVFTGPRGPRGLGSMFESRSAAAARTIETSLNFLRTAGYWSPGDLGGALYKRGSVLTAGGFQSADGAFWDLAEPIWNPIMWGCKGTGSPADDDLTAFRLMLANCRARTIDLLNKNYFLGAAGLQSGDTELLTWKFPAKFVGSGMNDVGSVFVVDADTPLDVDVLVLRPDPTVIGESLFGWEWTGTRIMPESGNPGQHGFVIDLPDSVAAFLAKFVMERNWIGAFSRRAFSLTKAGSTVDVFFTSVIEKNRFDSGPAADRVVSLARSGDSISFLDNTVHGPGIGIYSEGVPGAAMQVYERNNVTAEGGAFYLKNCAQWRIVKNQTEQLNDHTGADSAQIVVENSFDGTIEDNNINTHGKCNGVRYKGTSSSTRNRIVGKNVISIDEGFYHVIYDNNCGKNNFIGEENSWVVLPTGIVDAPRVLDNSNLNQIFAGGWRSLVHLSKTADYTVVARDNGKIIVGAAANLTFTMPIIADVPDGVFVIRNAHATQLIVAASGSDTFEGVTSQKIEQNGTVYFIAVRGTTTWRRIFVRPPGITEAAASIAAATTTDIGLTFSDRITISGSAINIASFGTAALRRRFVRVLDVNTIVHNAGSLICPGNANIVTAAGDSFIAESDSASVWRIVQYQRQAVAP